MLSSHLTVKVFNTFSSKLPFERVPLLASSYTYMLMIIKFLFLPDLWVVLDLYVQTAPGPLHLQCPQAHQMQCSRIADIIFLPSWPPKAPHLDEGCHYFPNSFNWLWGTDTVTHGSRWFVGGILLSCGSSSSISQWGAGPNYPRRQALGPANQKGGFLEQPVSIWTDVCLRWWRGRGQMEWIWAKAFSSHPSALREGTANYFSPFTGENLEVQEPV